MSGSGHREPDKITDKVRDELLAALRLLFRQVGQQAVDLDLDPGLTVFVMDIPAEINDVPIPRMRPQVLGGAPRWEAPVKRQPLLAQKAVLAAGGSVQFEPASCREPVFAELAFETHGVSFESMAVRRSHALPLALEAAREGAIAPEVSCEPAVASVPVESMTARIQKRAAVFKTASRATTRFYLLPIKKTAIQPNRFAPAVREKLRQTLAERAKTRPANIQLRVVFERMHANLYSSITPDDQGNLLCTPKPEMVGKNQEAHRAESPVAYLVVGMRLDTKEDVRALVPASVLEEVR